MRIRPRTAQAVVVGCLLFANLCKEKILAQGIFSISEARFGSYVSGKFELANESTGQISRSALRRGELWLMVTVIGDAGTMKHLKENKSLWLQADIWADGKKWDFTEIGMSYSDWEEDGERLDSQLSEQTVFTWRTRMRTTKIDAAVIEIKFWDKHRNSLSPVNYAGSYVARIEIK